MISIKSRIVEFVDYVDKTYKNNEEFFPDFQKSEESKIQAEKLVQKMKKMLKKRQKKPKMRRKE